MIRRLGNWIVIPLNCNGKRLEIISLCGMPESSKSDVTHSLLSQHHLIDAKVRLTKEHRKETFTNIKKHVISNGDTNNMIIARDYN